jgi:hypothetical protein
LLERCVRPAITEYWSGEVKPPSRYKQWAAVTTKVGATSVPPQNWRWKPFPEATDGRKAIAVCHGQCVIVVSVPPTMRPARVTGAWWTSGLDACREEARPSTLYRKTPGPASMRSYSEAEAAGRSSAVAINAANKGIRRKGIGRLFRCMVLVFRVWGQVAVGISRHPS